MDLADSIRLIAISLGLGLLVGMQRERVHAPLAGVRTFALITVLGTIAALLAPILGPWIVVAGLAAITLITFAGNFPTMRQPREDQGITTEIAILVMYVVGAYLVLGHTQIAVVVGAGVAVLLHAKPLMHRFVKRLGENEMRAIMQLVLISFVILPILPNEHYGPFRVFNPREIWWIVVLVVGISLGGYLAMRLYGENVGIVLGGIIGGLVSSTATTVSYARQASKAEAHAAAATLVILLATAVVYGRVLVEVFVVARMRFSEIAPPIAIMLAVAAVLSVVVWWRHRGSQVADARRRESGGAEVGGRVRADLRGCAARGRGGAALRGR